MEQPVNKTDPFTFAEIIDFEDITGESFDTINELLAEGQPRYKTIAILGHIKEKRVNPGVSFSQYIREHTADEIVKDAFGDLGEDGEPKDEEAKKDSTSSKRGQRRKLDSVSLPE